MKDTDKSTGEQCPTCGTKCRIEWSGLDLVANSGDETLATKTYIPLVESEPKEVELTDAEIEKEFYRRRGNIAWTTDAPTLWKMACVWAISEMKRRSGK